jgi:hypothetical protein
MTALVALAPARGLKLPPLCSPIWAPPSRTPCLTAGDNPFLECHFKTLKYQPEFPKRFGCIEDPKIFCRGFSDWYNQDHHHAGICLMTQNPV